ncbi:hypothetical protein EV368DRAFT_89644 [Lentinula lateritia]|uniref:Uncharacterized protein n=1 Tax=Lentinula aff. lateritia TaxID=2804960 RepID=A0ACC1TNR8_9AGAR|nr:hypothetical protein F5876DRAFT_80748 [Lentinula aff. lateritia]KAJ3846040.1 hypothetical protein EV368DRAFT_89644 [Lentinula lateritia]
MTPEETALLASIGVTEYWNIAQLALICSMYGFYLLLAFIALALLLKSGIPSSRPHQYLLGLTILILGLNTWAYIISVGIELVRTKYVFTPLSNGAGLEAQADVANANALPWSRMSIWASNLNLLVGDATVIWRAYAIYTGNRISQWFLVILMVLNGVCMSHESDFQKCFSTAMLIITSACDVANTPESLQTAVLAISATSIWTSLVANLVATLFIGAKLLEHHKTVKALYNGKHRSQVERLLLLLVESGTVLGVLQLLYAIFLTLEDFANPTENETAAYLIFNSLFSELVPMYPLAVIILVNLERAPLAESFHLTFSATPNVAESDSPHGDKITRNIGFAMPSHLSTIRFVEGEVRDVSTTAGSSFASDNVAQDNLEAAESR